MHKATIAQVEEGGLATTVWKNMAHELPPLPPDVVLPFGDAESRIAPTKVRLMVRLRVRLTLSRPRLGLWSGLGLGLGLGLP